MALFSLLRENLSPRQKLVLALNCNDLPSIEEVLQSGFDVNSRLLDQGGDRALHLACSTQNPNIEIVKKLFEFKADSNVRNDFGFLPIQRALSGGNVELVKYLLKNHNSDCEVLNYYWRLYFSDLSRGSGSTISSDMFTLMLIAVTRFSFYSETSQHTPTVSNYSDNFLEVIFNHAFMNNYHTCMKLMLIFGEKLKPDQVLENPITDEQKEFKEWTENFKLSGAQTLQHICRMAVRRSINRRHNVIYAVEKLDLPKSLKQFLKFSDFTTCGL